MDDQNTKTDINTENVDEIASSPEAPRNDEQAVLLRNDEQAVLLRNDEQAVLLRNDEQAVLLRNDDLSEVQSPTSDHSEAEITPEPVDEEQVQLDRGLTESAIENTGAAEEANMEEPKEPEEPKEESSEGENEQPENEEASESASEEQVNEKSSEQDNETGEEQKQASDVNDESTPYETADSTGNTNLNARWYVVHTYSGHENKVATALKQRVESEHLEHKILDVLVPTQEKIEIRGGKKGTVKEKIFPGYILVKMELDDNTWLAVRTTQGVTSFVGIGNKPTPISEAEVRTIVRFMNQEAAPTFKEVFLVNDTVKIIDGPFAEFIGKVDSVDKERGKVKVLVSIFGRETPVELDFLQVAKL